MSAGRALYRDARAILAVLHRDGGQDTHALVRKTGLRRGDVCAALDHAKASGWIALAGRVWALTAAGAYEAERPGETAGAAA